MKNNYFIKNKLGFIIVGLILIVCFPFYFKNRLELKEVKENGITTVGKFIKYEKFPKSRNYLFEYKINNKSYYDNIRKAPNEFSSNVGRFYEIKYLDKYENIIVSFESEITDTTRILNAGFSLEDIEK